MTDALLVLPHQLFAAPPDLASRQAVLVEERLYFRLYPFHKRKLVFQRAAMCAYAEGLRAAGWQVRHIDALDEAADSRRLPALLVRDGISALHLHEPCDDWLMQGLQAAAEVAGLALHVHETPQFMLSRRELAGNFALTRKRYRHQQFYETQRRRLGLLMDDDGKPTGGRFSFDGDNRKPFPRKAKAPPLPPQPDTPWLQDAAAWVDRHFPDNPGTADGSLRWPVTRSGAEAWLDDFLHRRFHGFGTWEDAIVAQEPVLHHSLLSPLLNAGLLLPGDVCTRALDHARQYGVPLNDVEGFLRQVLGWREFIRGLYVCHGRQQRSRNYWGFSHPLPAAFYTASTGVEPVDIVIRRVLELGYCHHIERLMILGCFMLLCECHPHGVYQWFMELFVDAYDWVMVPNVYGMSQFADGGLMATKPYICGSNYVLKMSNFPRGEWCEIWDALFWRFIHRHAARLRSNPRLALLVRNFTQRTQAEQTRLLARADEYLAHLHACTPQRDAAV